MQKLKYVLLAAFPFLLTSCNAIGDKSTSMSIIYLATVVLSLLLLIGYFVLIHKKNIWFVFLLGSVFVVNTGYWLLSVSKNIDMALFSNRMAYLGSVFLPMAMIMIILKVTKLKYPNWLPYLLSVINVFVFLVAASYPYLDIYYKSVTLKTVGGVTVLSKVYGAWHPIYLFFLLAYFAAMIGVIIYTSKKKKLSTRSQSIVLAIAVFVNICVWLLEQLVDIDFEFLSVSYIISELFLIGLYLAIEDSDKEKTDVTVCEEASVTTLDNPDEAKLMYFKENLPRLTPTEAKIYTYYTEGKTTKEIMALLNIKENTLKYHNKNIYSKLGVSSRKELLYFSKMN